jgi:dihydrofolate reductase
VAKLIYSAIMSVDGYIEDDTGKFEWAVPGENAHAFINDLMRPIGIYLHGRRMYEVMAAWETDAGLATQSSIQADFARIWQAADKVVFSRTLDSPLTTRTSIERTFDPEKVRQMKAAAESDLSIGGSELAAETFKYDLIDECHLFLAPISVGRGKRSLPSNPHLVLELADQRQFPDGMMHLHYCIRR